MTDTDIMFAGKLYRPIVEIKVCHCGSRVIRVIQPHHGSLVEYGFRYLFEVRQVIILFQEGHIIRLTAGKNSTHGVDGITGVRYQDIVSGLGKAESHVTDTFLGTQERQYLRIRVKGNTETLPVPVCHCFPKLR